MANQDYAREVLLDQVLQNVDCTRALKRVYSELGPDSMTGREAEFWYQRYKNEVEGMRSSQRDRLFINNQMFLSTQRSVIHTSSRPFILMCRTKENAGRFVFICDFPDHFVLDAFQGVEKKLEINWMDVPQFLGGQQQAVFLQNLCLVNDDRVFGTMRLYGPPASTFVFIGTFDSQNSVLTFKKIVEIADAYQPDVFVTETFRLLYTQGSDSMRVKEVVVDGDDVSVTNTVNVPFRMFFATLQDNRLFGFCGSEPKYIDELVEYSLIDGVKREHKIEEENWSKFKVDYTHPHVWMKNKLFVAVSDLDDSVSKIVEFNLSTLKWNETELEVDGVVRQLTVSNSSLFVHAAKGSGREKQSIFYRFQVG
ncbi:hypothetical protein M3Y95_00356900 [Aphelenchoides besseyi]|nr:hypothetical protein M3Y95_00356900 [Aphelenchoides besseyi]